MKKYFLIVLLYGCCTSCNLQNKEDKKQADSTNMQTTQVTGVSSKDTMGSADAKAKIKAIKNLNLKNFDIAWTEFSVSELKDIFCGDANNIERVRFFLGAFDTTITTQNKPKTMTIPLIMMQLRRSADSASTTAPEYNYYYYRGKVVCPPPEPCLGIEDEK